MKNIVLIGLMGSGKTLISKDLAKKLNRERFSTDEMIESKEQSTITTIVKDKGWPYFRDLEHSIIKEVSQKQGVIIDCGGGVVLNPANLELLKKTGTVFHLDASPDVLYQRLKGDRSRPLISGPDPQARLKELYLERRPLYDQADFTIDSNDASLQKPIAEILKKVS